MAIGTAAAVVGVATSLAGAGMSFAQAAKQKQAESSAKSKAEQYMADARKRLEVNYMDALSINKEPYERQREAMLSAGAQALEAGREGSERGSAAMAGRVLAQQQEGQGQIRDTMNRDIFNLEAASAEEDSRLRDVNTQLDLGVVSGAQAAAAAAADARQVAIGQGVQGVVGGIEQAIKIPDLYRQTNHTKQRAADEALGSNLNTISSQGMKPLQNQINGFAPSLNQISTPVPPGVQQVQNPDGTFNFSGIANGAQMNPFQLPIYYRQ